MTAVATRPVSFISHPQGMDERKDLLTARRALLRITDARPNEVITCAEICAALGREVSRATICSAKRSLGRDLPIEGVAAGGYVKLQPMPTLGAERCVNCANRAPLLSTCRRLKGRPVGLNSRCWGWEANA